MIKSCSGIVAALAFLCCCSQGDAASVPQVPSFRLEANNQLNKSTHPFAVVTVFPSGSYTSGFGGTGVSTSEGGLGNYGGTYRNFDEVVVAWNLIADDEVPYMGGHQVDWPHATKGVYYSGTLEKLRTEYDALVASGSLEVTWASVWVVSDQGSDEEGEYVADGSGWYNKDGSGSIMWRSDIDLREVHDDPNLNGIWIRDERGSGRNVGCTENNDPSDVTACTEWRVNYGYEEIVKFSVWAYEPEETDVAEETIDNSPIRLDGDLADGDQGQRVVKGATSGAVIELQLNISSIVAIKGWSTILEIDTDQVEFTGSFTASSYVPGLIALSSSSANGFSVGGTVLGSNATGSGDGTLGQFSVELLDGFSDQTTIRIVEVTLNLASGEREKIAVMNDLVISSEVEEPALAGDFDGSGGVDFNDFFMFADGFGGSDPLYDLDTSGKVDFNDFFIFADNFGKEERAKLIALAIKLIGLPQAASLGANYPNPFNSETTIPYAVGTQVPVTISLFDISGQLIRELVNHTHIAGQYKASWDGRDSGGAAASSGVYLVRLISGNHNETKKIMLMK